MFAKHFEGWYFKHYKDGETIAFIPGRAKNGAFVQFIENEGARSFDVTDFRVEHGVIYADDCVFSGSGIVIDLPGIKGKLSYGPLTPLKSDIMGPFRYFPMECRHGVISMRHEINGSLTVDGKEKRFDGGIGYIEKDSGISFPKEYLWLQCSCRRQKCSLMLSIAAIPFAGLHFTGCICAVVFGGREYRFATYRGVRILAAGPGHICLSQNGLLLEADVRCPETGHPLRSPVLGEMTGVVRESNKAKVHARLWDSGRLVMNMTFANAGYEYHTKNR